MERNKVIAAIGLLFLFVIVAVAISGFDGSSSKAKIKLESNTGWSGNIGSAEEGQRTVEGSGNKTFTVKGDIVSCSFQKDTREGFLRVRIIKDGEVVKEQETTADFGVVTIAD